MTAGDGSRLTVAMIVRDEGGFLEECLVHLRPLGCAVVVVDTGSRDDTVAIAQRHGCVVDTFAWRDDFAAARNAALAHCTTPWIFVLDADERLSTDDLQALGKLAMGAPDRAYRIVTRNYTHRCNTGEYTPCAPGDSFGRGFPGWFPSAKVRLFPNHPGVRFAGQVHELVNGSLARAGIPVEDSVVVVHHYGLAREAGRLREKQEAYLRLGLAKAAAEPGNAQAFAELGHQYLELDDLANALRAYKRAVGLAPAQGIYLADLGAALHLAGRKDEARAALQLAVQRAEGHVDAWRNLGVLHAEAGCWSEALNCFRQATALNPSQGELRRYLALALSERGDLAAAALEARAAVDRSPGDAQARTLLEDLTRRAAQSAGGLPLGAPPGESSAPA